MYEHFMHSVIHVIGRDIAAIYIDQWIVIPIQDINDLHCLKGTIIDAAGWILDDLVPCLAAPIDC